jgi:hypothetical protein
MNSKQRRQAERNHPHTIVMKQPDNVRYFEWDNHIYRLKVWCNKNAKAGWKQKNNFQSAEFGFTKHKDAMVFALKWL